MCGIVGLWSGGVTRPDLVACLTATLTHRGPDDSGCWIDEQAGLGLGHRRLSIVDLSPHGQQPMLSASHRFVLTFNGEIYNHQELRASIDDSRQTPEGGWRGHSDTETFLECIATWGLSRALERAVGMFAFGLWDRDERKLFLVRDRFGEKPLYYGWVGRDLLFASELKALEAHPAFDNEINRQAVAAYAARLYVPTPLSIYQDIFKLQPGCILELDGEAVSQRRDNAPAVGSTERGLRLTCYWSYSEIVRRGLDHPIVDKQEALASLENGLSTAVRSQSTADVPVGAFLSGGIDSSTIVALYQKHSPVPVRTFTIGFSEPGFDEAQYAKDVAAHLGTQHHEVYVTPREAHDVIPMLPQVYDEPFADPSQIPTFLVSRIAREQVSVALTGDGGDELFCGYSRYGTAWALWRQFRNVPRSVRAAATWPLRHLPIEVWTAVARMMPQQPHGRWETRLPKAIRLAAAANSFEEVYSSLLHQWPYEQPPIEMDLSPSHGLDFDLGKEAPDLVRAMYCDANAYLTDDVLCKVDRAAMAASLETRVPFLDCRVAEVAARIPLAMKIKGTRGKTILRDLLGRELPADLFDRPKRGFAVPVGEWMKGPLRPWAESLLEPSRMAAEGWFDVDVVQRRWIQHRSGARYSADALWAILMFQSWLDRDRSAEIRTESLPRVQLASRA